MSQKFLSEVNIQALNNATTDTDRFLVSDSGTIKYRTGAEVLSDIGGQAALTNPITGTGTLNYVSKFTSATTLGNSQIFDNGTNVGVGTTNPTSRIHSVTSASGPVSYENRCAIFGYNTSTDTVYNNPVGIAGRVLTSGGIAVYGDAATGNGWGGYFLGKGYFEANVGIGTTSPDSILQTVESTTGITQIHIRNSATTGSGTTRLKLSNATDSNSSGFQIINSGNNGSVSFVNYKSTDLSLWTNSTERMRITSGGNVGIGTTVPDTLLHVSSLNSSILRLESTNTALGLDAVVGEIQFEANDASASGTGVKAKIGAYSDVAAGNTVGLRFFTGGAGVATATEKVRISATGNVGIGATTPSTLLQVGNQNSSSDLVSLGVSYNTSRTTRGGIVWRDATNITGRIHTEYDGTTISMQFGSLYNSGYNANPLMTIRGNGNVGIGTTSPAVKLNVAGGDAAFDFGGFDNIPAAKLLRAGDEPTLRFYRPSGGTPNARIFQIQNTVGDLTFGYALANKYSESTFTEAMRITSTGNVGIGTTAPSYPLYVAAQVSNISIYADYDIVAYSDQSVKENIRPIENALERVIKSRGVLYDRIDSGEKDNIGFIAQELEVEFPELVVTNENGTKAVKYQNTVAVLFEAIKEQQKQIEELKQIVNGLTN